MDSIKAFNTIQPTETLQVTGTASPGQKRSLDVASPISDLLVETVSNITYVGEASIGSAKSSAVWRVFRFDNATGRLSYSSGLYNQIWDNRASLSYT